MKQQFFWDEQLTTVHSERLTETQTTSILTDVIRVLKGKGEEALAQDVNKIIQQLKETKNSSRF